MGAMPMACATTFVAMILVVLAAMLLHATLVDADFIARTCKNTDNTQCVAVLSAEPRSVNTTTVLDLGSISLDIATSNGKGNDGIINDRASNYEGMPEGETLDFYNQVYADTAADLTDTRDSLISEDKCEKAFTDINIKSLVAEVDQRMKECYAMAGGIIDLLYLA